MSKPSHALLCFAVFSTLLFFAKDSFCEIVDPVEPQTEDLAEDFYSAAYKAELIFTFTPPPGWREYYGKCDSRYQPIVRSLKATSPKEAVAEAKNLLFTSYGSKTTPRTVECGIWVKLEKYFRWETKKFENPMIIGVVLRNNKDQRLCALGANVNKKLTFCPERRMAPIDILEPSKNSTILVRHQ